MSIKPSYNAWAVPAKAAAPPRPFFEQVINPPSDEPASHPARLTRIFLIATLFLGTVAVVFLVVRSNAAAEQACKKVSEKKEEKKQEFEFRMRSDIGSAMATKIAKDVPEKDDVKPVEAPKSEEPPSEVVAAM